MNVPVTSTDRTLGTIFGSDITRLHGSSLPDDTFTVKCTGGGGQSFGAFIPKGLTLELEGDCNDYMGKGLSGGKIIVYPPKGSPFKPEENIIIGNVALYGATSGKAFINGMAGAIRRAQLRRLRGGGGRGRPWLRIHDRRPGGGAGTYRQELRGGHVRRHRLCVG